LDQRRTVRRGRLVGAGGGFVSKGESFLRNANARSEEDRSLAQGVGGWRLQEAFREPERTER